MTPPTFICAHPAPPGMGPLPDAGEGLCCYGAAVYGPDRCTCWVEVCDRPQAPARADASNIGQPGDAPCSTCAYRPDSPERTGAAHVDGDEATLRRLVAEGRPFYCHAGMRHVVAYEHPSGARVDLPPEHATAAFRPLMVDGVPYQADGTPALLCAGWFARRLQHVQENTPRD